MNALNLIAQTPVMVLALRTGRIVVWHPGKGVCHDPATCPDEDYAWATRDMGVALSVWVATLVRLETQGRPMPRSPLAESCLIRDTRGWGSL